MPFIKITKPKQLNGVRKHFHCDVTLITNQRFTQILGPAIPITDWLMKQNPHWPQFYPLLQHSVIPRTTTHIVHTFYALMDGWNSRGLCSSWQNCTNRKSPIACCTIYLPHTLAIGQIPSEVVMQIGGMVCDFFNFLCSCRFMIPDCFKTVIHLNHVHSPLFDAMIWIQVVKWVFHYLLHTVAKSSY